MNSSAGGTNDIGEVPGGDVTIKPKYPTPRIGRGRGKFSREILLPIPQPGIVSEMEQQISSGSNLPTRPVPVPVQQTNIKNKFQRLKELHLKNYQREESGDSMLPASRTITDENIAINVRHTPGMGMRDADPDYLSLMHRHINNVNDPESENWERD